MGPVEHMLLSLQGRVELRNALGLLPEALYASYSLSLFPSGLGQFIIRVFYSMHISKTVSCMSNTEVWSVDQRRCHEGLDIFLKKKKWVGCFRLVHVFKASKQ